MSSPLTTISHKTRDVQQGLLNNCWYVYHRPSPIGGVLIPAAARVYQTRTRRGRFHARYLTTGHWYTAAPADLLFQQ